MQHNICLTLFVFLFSILVCATENLKSSKPYIVILGPSNLNQVRVNIENYEPNKKDIKKIEINFGDGVRVTNKKDLIHKYLENGIYTLTIKTWDHKNTATVYTQALDINTQFQVSSVPNSSVLGPVSLKNNQKYKLDLTSSQAVRLYKVSVFRNTENQKPFKLNRFCKRDYNVEINDIEIFQEDEINCQTTQIEKFAWLNEKNIIKFEAEEAKWRQSFKVQISAVEIIKNVDTIAPRLIANISSNAITNNPKVHISVTDASNTTTYVWNAQNQLIGTLSDKEFDLNLTEGLNSFVLHSVDSANNRSEYLYISNILLDTVPATLNLALNSDYIFSAYPQNFTLTVTSDEDLTSLTINNQLATLIAPNTYTFNLLINQPGALSINLKAYDLAGNEKIQIYNVNFGIDNLPPIISSNISSNSFTNLSTVTFTITDNASTNTEIYQNEQLVTSTQSKQISLNMVEGINNFAVQSTDAYGNKSQVFNLNNTTFDKTAPILTSNLAGSYLFNSFPQSIAFKIYANEDLSNAELDGNIISLQNPSELSYSKTVLAEGPVNIIALVKDKAGNQTQKTFSFNVTLDNIKPVVSISNLPSLTKNESILAQFNVVESGNASTSIRLNGREIAIVNEKMFSYNLLLDEGDNLVEAISIDEAGNVSATASKTIRRDSLSPVLSDILPQEAYKSDQLVVMVSGSSNEALAKVLINGQQAILSPDNLSFNLTLNFADYGQKIINIEATDLAGNITNETRNILLKDFEAPVISTNISNGYTTYDLISINVTGDDITNLKVLINDQEVYNQQATSYQSTFIYGEGIEHKIDVTATNARGQQAHSTFISTLDSRAPFINVFNFATQTTEEFVRINYTYYDVSPTVLRVYVDQQKVFETSENAGVFDVPLLTDGDHIVSVTAIDAAGNLSEPFVFNVYRDTTAPVITLISPQNGDYVDGTGFKVKFKVDDAQVSVLANDNGVTWDENEKLWVAHLVSFSTDDFPITLKAQNLVGLTSELRINVKPLLSPLVPELIGLYEDSVNNKMIIRGADGATRPNLTLNVKTSFFSS